MSRFVWTNSRTHFTDYLVLQALQQLKQGKLSRKELCEKCIERASKVRELNAFVTETPEVARQQLQSVEQGINALLTIKVLSDNPVALFNKAY